MQLRHQQQRAAPGVEVVPDRVADCGAGQQRGVSQALMQLGEAMQVCCLDALCSARAANSRLLPGLSAVQCNEMK